VKVEERTKARWIHEHRARIGRRRTGLGALSLLLGRTTTAGPVSVASSMLASSGPPRRAAIDLTAYEPDQPAHTHRAVGWSNAPMIGFSRQEPSMVSGAVSMSRQLAANVSGGLPASRRSRSPGSTATTSARLRRSVCMTREVLQVNASVDCDEAVARETQYLRQRSKHLESC
jgi:hypothetical protein